ncbi:hypothetical protein [Methylobacterium sp. Leaf466]|uniref:hypothetical protein n=1 Tax=Methylobacterium sp. Leaf466 TaxID=1736386 RepID=UPI00070048C6|nr:hypothetical protein [Methylobacterium sp. Leaf466]KQT88883.1 hypothetical protein ASG59_13455 [Methylobacterium sp. Leaf466]
MNERSRGRYDGFGGKQDGRAAALGDLFTKGQGEAPGDVGAGSAPDALPQSGSNLVVQEQAKQGGKAAAYGQQQGAALGQLRAFGDVMGDASRGQARDAGELGQINGFRQGSSAAVPYELEAANGKGAGFKMLGDILGGAGQIGMSASLNRNVRLDPNVPIPSMANVEAASTGTIDGLGRALPAQPMRLGSSFADFLPTFAQAGNAYRMP